MSKISTQSTWHPSSSSAKAIGAALEGIGFTVLKAENLSRREMNRQLQSFVSRLEAGDEAVFFFAGHGVEISGRNYLLPTDVPGARPGQEDFVKAEAIPVDQVLDMIRSRGTRVSILVLDACRDNPFPKVGTRSLGGGRGLARMPAPEGAFIMYSAGVGQTALDRLSNDDPNPNSVFTRSLIPLMQKPGMSLVQAARAVRRDVQKLAATVSHDQRPAYYDEVTGDFFFAGRGKTAPPAATQQPAPINPALAAWNAAKDTESVSVLEDFIAKFGDSFYASLAKAKLAELKKKEAETEVAVGVFPKSEAEAEEIYRSPASFVAGNPDGDVSVVEFFDYNCGYCRRALPDVVKLIDTDDKVRVVLKELAIFGEDSEAAARAALAANKQGKYFEMHQKLFSEPGKANKEKALQIAQELGMDVEQLEQDMEDPEIQKTLDETLALAVKLGVEGTP